MHEEVGPYILLSTVQRDWLGVVHRAFDTRAERVVRLRVVAWPPSPIDRKAVMQALEAWCAAIKSLEHANLDAQSAVAAQDEGITIAGEWGGGTPLGAVLESGASQPVPRSHRWAAGILLGLGRLHRAGLLHGKLDAGAIHVDAADEARLCEAGLHLPQRFPWLDPASEPGWPMGWSPEDLRGEPSSERSDLYGAGLLLYRMLTGRTAFTGAPSEVMHRMLDATPPPPSTVNSALGTRFDAVVSRALAPRQQARFASAAEFLQALNAAASATAGPTPWTPGVIDPIVDALADAVGPMAKVLVTAECRRSTGIDQLTAALAARIDDVRLRNRFLGVVRGLGVVGGLGGGVPQPAPGRGWPPAGDALVRLKAALSGEFGPMAALLVDRAAAGANSREEFVERLSATVPGLDRRRDLLDGLDRTSPGASD